MPGEEPDARSTTPSARRRFSARTSSASPTSAPNRKSTLSEAVKAVQERLPQIIGMLPKDFSVGFGAEVEQQAKAFDQLRMVLILALRARLRRDGVAVRVAARSVHHHVLGADGRHRRRAGAQADGHVVQHAGLHRHHHAGRHRRQQRHPAGRLHQRAAPPRRPAAARSGRAGRPHAAAADSDDVDRHGARPRADVARHRRRQRAAGAAGARRHRRADDVAAHHAGARADGLHASSKKVSPGLFAGSRRRARRRSRRKSR